MHVWVSVTVAADVTCYIYELLAEQQKNCVIYIQLIQ